MTTQQEGKLDAILRKVQALIAVADDPATTPEAAETYRAKAEALMLEYRITETMFTQASTSSGGVSPVWRKVRVCPLTSEFERTYRYLWASCVDHVDGKSASGYETDEETGQTWRIATCLGYESDLRYAEMLFTAFSLAFSGKMEPRYNPALSDQENAYIMRSAGMEGRRIAMAIYGREDKPLRVKVRNMFRAEAAARGESVEGLSGRGANVATYRESYADGFENEVYWRLHRMKLSTGDTGALVLKSRKDAILEAWYEKFPHLRPNPNANRTDRMIGDDRKDCAKCKKAKSGYCRDHAYLKPSTARYRERSYSAAGYARGQTAAQSVDLGGSKGSRVSGSGGTRALEG